MSQQSAETRILVIPALSLLFLLIATYTQAGSNYYKNHVVTPVITTGVVTGNITACAGTASANPYLQQFTVSGSDLTADIVASAPVGFELSLAAGSGYGSSVTLVRSVSSISNVIIYVRSAASASGSISGNVILASSGADSKNVPVSGKVNALPVMDAVPNQVLVAGSATAAVNFNGTGNFYSWVNNTPGIGLPANGTGAVPLFTAVNSGNTALTATITVTPSSKELAYVPNAWDNTVSVINVATNSVIATIPVGTFPAGASVSPDGKRVYVPNHSAGSVSVINAVANTVMATISLGNFQTGARDILVSRDGSRVYVSTYTSVKVINTANNTVIKTIAGDGALAVSPDGNRLYVVSSNDGYKILVYDSANYALLSTISVDGNYYDITLSPDGSKLYVPNFSSVSVFNTATNALVASIPLKGARGVAVSPDGSRLYVSRTTGTQDLLSMINTATNDVLGTITVGYGVQGVAVSRDGAKVYTLNEVANNVSVINTANFAVEATIAAGHGPFAYGNFMYAGSGCTGTPVTFTITANKPATGSAIAALSYVRSSAGTFTAVSGPADYNYTTSFGAALTTTDLEIKSEDDHSNITVNGITELNHWDNQVTLNSGESTVFDILITSEDGLHTKTCRVTFLRKPSPTDASLNNLVFSSGPLTPAFVKNTTSYTAAVGKTVTSLTVTPTVASPVATVKVNGITVASGSASAAIPIHPGSNTINTVVNAADGTTSQTYTVVVTRHASDIAVLSAIGTNPDHRVTETTGPADHNRAIVVPSGVTSVAFSATPQDASATIKINNTRVAAGALSAPVALTGLTTVVTIKVTAEDGTTVKTYGITVTRRPSDNAVLSQITTTPDHRYTATTGPVDYNRAMLVPASVTSIAFAATPQNANATIRVNGTIVASNTPSSPVALDGLTTVVNILVTAEDGITTKSYAMTVTRRPSDNAVLSSITNSAGARLTATTGPADYNRSVFVAAGVSSITFAAVPQNAHATIKINGTPIAGGASSAPISLATGPNKITIAVTAENKIATKIYSITVTRAASLIMASKQSEKDLRNDQLSDVPEDKPIGVEISVPQGLSPNGDGINDRLAIAGIDAFPDNTVTVMSRNGDVIYEVKGYDNVNKAFDGRGTNGTLQQPGTYFYSVEYKDGSQVKRKTGYLVIKY